MLSLLVFFLERWRPLLLSYLLTSFLSSLVFGTSFIFSGNYFLTCVNFWLIFELVFLVFNGHKKMKIQLRKPPMYKMNYKQRLQLFERCLNTNGGCHKQFTSEWMNEHPFEKLKIGNVKEWISWGFFAKRSCQLDEEERKELKDLIKFYTDYSGETFKPGHNGKAQGLFATFHAVDSHFRPLVYYFFVKFLLQTVLVPIVIGKMLGFEYDANGNTIPYWILRNRNKVEKKESPVIFFHGLGIGLVPYVDFFKELIFAFKTFNVGRDIILCEIHMVSQHISPYEVYRHNFSEIMPKILQKNGYDKATFIGHSFGSIVTSWMVQECPDFVENVILIDPACLFLHHVHAMKSILYQKYTDHPHDAYKAKLFHIIFRGDLIIQWLFRREFSWWSQILFLEQIPKSVKVSVVISEFDAMVPVARIREHIKISKENKLLQNVSLVELYGCEHGMFLGVKSFREDIISAVVDIVERDVENEKLSGINSKKHESRDTASTSETDSES